MGYLFVCGAAVLWAVGGTVAGGLIGDGASAIELTEGRAWIATAFLGLVVAAGGRRLPSGPGGRRWLLVPFGLALAVANSTYYMTIERLPVAVAIVIQYTAPVLVVLWASLVARRWPSGRVIAALLLAVGGVVLLAQVWRSEGLSVTGLLIGGVASVAFASYMLLGEQVSRAFGSLRSVAAAFGVSSVFWIAVQLVRGEARTLSDPRFRWPIVFLGLCTTVAPFLLFVAGVRLIAAPTAGIVSTLEPLTAAVLSWIFLGQALDGIQIGGGALVLCGIVLAQATGPGTRV